MTEREYEDWRAEGDQRVGRCPFCERPGWIVGDTEWCEHYAATYDAFGGSEPISPLTEGEPFLTYERFLVALRDQDEEGVHRLLTSLPPREWDFVKIRIALGSAAEVLAVLDLVELPEGPDRQEHHRRVVMMLHKLR